MFTCGCIVLSLPKRAHVDWNWPISREKYLKRVRSVKCRFICLLSELQAPSDGLLILSLVFDILLANNAKKHQIIIIFVIIIIIIVIITILLILLLTTKCVFLQIWHPFQAKLQF